MAAAAIVFKTLEGKAPAPGARACIRDLELDDYQSFFARRKIVTGFRMRAEDSAPLYKRILGDAWDDLPWPIRTMHEVSEDRVAEGRADVDRGSSILSRAIAAVVGFPSAGHDLPVTVRFSSRAGAEIWTRTFAGKSFSSTQFEGRGSSEGLLCERFGPMTFAMALVLGQGRLHLVLRRWSMFGVPLPMSLSPRSTAYEAVEEGRFRFNVEIGLPLIGLIVRYRGWLIASQSGPSREGAVARAVESSLT
jgi:hypothetical protein